MTATKPRSAKCSSLPPSSIHCSLLSFLTPFPSSAKDLKTQVAESRRLNATWAKQEAASIQAPSALVIVGSRRLEAIHMVLLSFWAQIHAASARQPHVLRSSAVAFSSHKPRLFPLSLCNFTHIKMLIYSPGFCPTLLVTLS